MFFFSTPVIAVDPDVARCKTRIRRGDWMDEFLVPGAYLIISRDVYGGMRQIHLVVFLTIP